MNHTPGPWKSVDEIVVDNSYLKIALCDIFKRPTEVNLANARLIASAPELLEALKRILATSTMLTAVHAMDESYLIAKQAIAKAEGNL